MSRDLAYRIDGALVEPAAFYRVACEPRRSVVVEACAGAGKTWMLVSRILRALLAGAQPQEILAITFTRKAAGEMRQRLQDWLLAYARADDATRQQALVDRGCTPEEARALGPQLAALYPRLLSHRRGVEIRTFHGWFSQLLRAAPLAVLEPLGLSADLEPLEDRSELRPHYLRRFLRNVHADDGLRADYATLVRDRGRQAVDDWLEQALERRVELARADAAGVLDDSVPPAGAPLPGMAPGADPTEAVRLPSLVASLGALAGALGAVGKVKPRDAATGIETALTTIADPIARLAALREALFTKDGERRKLGAIDGLEAAWEALDAIELARQQQTAHETHRRLTRLSRVLLAAYADTKRERGLADMADLELYAEHVLADAELSGWVQERLDARVRHLLIDEFQDTSPLQWRTLVSWLGGYAGAGGGASGQQPLSVFIVGDPKQSIYRFRRADPRVFAEARDFVHQALGGGHLACDHTRRNAPAVLAALNGVFERARDEGRFDGFRTHTTDVDPQARGAVVLMDPVPYVPKPRSPRGEAMAPAVWRDSLRQPRIEAEEARKLTEARRVAAAIGWLLQARGLRPGEIQVLARRRASLALVSQALRERGIAHVAPEQRELMEAPEVRDLVALLDVLTTPSHDLSLAQALKSPLIGASDDDLVVLVTAARAAGLAALPALLAGPAGSPSNATLAGPAAKPSTQPAWQRPALERARVLLAGWSAAAQVLPPHDLLDRILAESDGVARYAAVVPPADRPRALAALDALLAQSLKLDGARYATPYSFVRALKRRRVLLPSVPPGDAVALLTVHGAKGLEARAVFIVDTQPLKPRPAQATLLVDWPAEAAHPACCAFLASEARCPPSLQALLDRERADRAREELNGLYVAMTRARELLVLSATEPHQAQSEISAWQRVADAVAAEPTRASGASGAAGAAGAVDVPCPDADGLRDAVAATATASALVDAEDTLRLLALPQLAPAEARRAESPQRVGAGTAPVGPATAVAPDSEAARLGRAVHRVLEWLPATEALAAAAQAAALEFGLPAPLGPRVASIARQVLASPACAHFFDTDGLHWQGNEVALTWQGQSLRIDRLVALKRPGGIEWWVLDYKLQHAPLETVAYREQLATYRDAVQALQPGESVQAAFITGHGEVVVL